MRDFKTSKTFERDLRTLSRKYRNIAKNFRREIDKVAEDGPDARFRLAGMVDEAPVYKLRLALDGKGKRGGARVIYYCDDRLVAPLFIYAKGAMADIPIQEINDALVALRIGETTVA